jgi:hypothetical protein
VIAALRPDSWALPLFLHVLGSIALAGTVAAAGILAAAARRQQTQTRVALLRRLAFRTLLFAALPAYLLMRGGAQWILDREDVAGTPTWVGIGFAISDAGLVVLVALIVLAAVSARSAQRGGGGSATAMAVAVLAPVYLAGLAVAWWAMTAKPG